MRHITAALALALCSCSDDPSVTKSADDIEETATADDEEETTGIEDEERGGETYSEFDERRDSYDGSHGSYAGDDCTKDCGGHRAGYKWAEKKGIDDPDDCGGKSWSFEEGCRAYAEEQ